MFQMQAGLVWFKANAFVFQPATKNAAMFGSFTVESPPEVDNWLQAFSLLASGPPVRHD
jgi:hypothetical protein